MPDEESVDKNETEIITDSMNAELESNAPVPNEEPSITTDSPPVQPEADEVSNIIIEDSISLASKTEGEPPPEQTEFALEQTETTQDETEIIQDPAGMEKAGEEAATADVVLESEATGNVVEEPKEDTEGEVRTEEVSPENQEEGGGESGNDANEASVGQPREEPTEADTENAEIVSTVAPDEGTEEAPPEEQKTEPDATLERTQVDEVSTRAGSAELGDLLAGPAEDEFLEELEEGDEDEDEDDMFEGELPEARAHEASMAETVSVQVNDLMPMQTMDEDDEDFEDFFEDDDNDDMDFGDQGVDDVGHVRETKKHKPRRKKRSKQETVDRDMYYSLYMVYDKEYQAAKMKNNYLQKRMTEHYRRRKMEHVLKETLDLGASDPAKKLYEKMLDYFEEATDHSCREHSRIQNEMNVLNAKYADKSTKVSTLYNHLLRIQEEVVKDISKSQDGANAEKLSDRYLKRQRSQMNYMVKLRREYIKFKYLYQDRQNQLSGLDHLGPGMHLSDYEQLKVDNRNFTDRLEDKELELSHLRYRYNNNIQILAHRREKETAVMADIAEKLEILTGTEIDVNNARLTLNELKQHKVAKRKAIVKVKEEAGLISRPILLRDMKSSFEEVNTLTNKLQEYKTQYATTSSIIRRARLMIKERRNDQSSLKSSETSMVYIPSAEPVLI